MDLLKIENIDDLIKKKDSDTRQSHPLYLKAPSRTLITGASGGGKTNLLANILLKNLIYYDRIYMYSKHLHQDKYKFIHNYLQNLEESCKKAGMKNCKIIMKWTDDINELVHNDDLDKKFYNLIIIDDFPILTKAQKGRIAKLYCSCRHKRGSIITLSQLYFQNERALRNNLSYVFVGDNGNKKELSLLSSELACDLNIEQFKKMYKMVHQNKYQFLLIDNECRDRRLKYRKNLDQPINTDYL